MSDAPDPSETPEPGLDRARRRLLRVSAYVAPAVLGTMLTRQAAAQSSCAPATCTPSGGPCAPSACGPQA